MSEPTKPGIEFYGGYQVYSESGVDLTLLRENLKRSATERLSNNSRMVSFFAVLDRSNAGRAAEGRTTSGGPGMLDVEAFLRRLAEERVRYVLIGGLAMRAQGSAHVTEDFDLCYCRDRGNVTALASALAPLHPYMRGAPPDLPFRFDAPTILAGLNFTLTTSAGDIDVLGEVAGVGPYERCLALSDEKELYGFNVRVLSVDGLIAAKRAAGRVKDRLHLLELEELKKMRDSAS